MNPTPSPTVQRYLLTHEGDMMEHDEGFWVEFEDFERVKKQRDILELRVKELESKQGD